MTGPQTEAVALAAPSRGLAGWLRALARELGGLLSDTVTTWWQLWSTVVALTLLGWVAYYASVLASAQLATLNAWLVIVVLAIGVVLRLATLAVAIRAVADRLGAVTLMRQVAPEEAADDERDRSLLRLLSLTMLPFLGIYAAFGYVQSFARDVVLLSGLNRGLAGVLNDLNPAASVTVGALVVAAIIGLYVLRRVLDAAFDHTRNPLFGGLSVLLEATLLLLIALSGFRLFEQFSLWWNDRAVVEWWELSVDWLTSWLHWWSLPAWVHDAWNFVSSTFWPVLWEVVSKPIAWLALTALVVGSRIRSFADLWNAQPVGEHRAARVHARLASSTRVSRVVTHTQDALFGDIDDKYLPTWHALRLVLKAGWIPLSALILAYGILELGGDWLTVAVLRLFGGTPAETGMMTLPLVELIPDVLVMSLQITLLGAAFVRIMRHRANPAPAPVDRLHRLAEVGLVILLVISFTLVWMARPSDSTSARTAAIGTDLRLDAQVVRVESVDYASDLRLSFGTAHTDAAFVVVHFSCYRPGSDGEPPQVELVNGSRLYKRGGWGGYPTLPDPGFEQTVDVVYEIAPEDLNSGLSARVTPGAGVTAFHDELLIPLLIPDDAASQLAGRVADVEALGTRRAR